jgi:hypothetical protein
MQQANSSPKSTAHHFPRHGRANPGHSSIMKLLLPSLSLTDTARHFIMWDDPDWMFGQLDRFLSLAKPGPVR